MNPLLSEEYNAIVYPITLFLLQNIDPILKPTKHLNESSLLSTELPDHFPNIYMSDPSFHVAIQSTLKSEMDNPIFE